MANLTSLIGIASALFLRIEEAKTAMTKIEGSDPKSQFMRRDLRFKCVKLGYEACSLAPAVSSEAVAEVAQRPRVAVEEVLVVPANAASAQEENETLTRELEALEAKGAADTQSDIQAMGALQASVAELTARRAALLAELAGVEKKLATEEKKLTVVQQRVETIQKQCAQKAESLRAQRDVSEQAVAEA